MSVILMKLEASRMQDVADISRMVKYADEQARIRIREIVKKYRPQDLEDLEQIIQIEMLFRELLRQPSQGFSFTYNYQNVLLSNLSLRSGGY